MRLSRQGLIRFLLAHSKRLKMLKHFYIIVSTIWQTASESNEFRATQTTAARTINLFKRAHLLSLTSVKKLSLATYLPI